MDGLLAEYRDTFIWNRQRYIVMFDKYVGKTRVGDEKNQACEGSGPPLYCVFTLCDTILSDWVMKIFFPRPNFFSWNFYLV